MIMPCRRPVTRDLTLGSNCIIPSKSVFMTILVRNAVSGLDTCIHRALDEPKMSQVDPNQISGHKLQRIILKLSTGAVFIDRK